jgi:hypothetical protein
MRTVLSQCAQVGSWLNKRRDVAIDSIVLYVAPRLAAAATVAAFLLMAILPPLYTAAVVGSICLAFARPVKKNAN